MKLFAFLICILGFSLLSGQKKVQFTPFEGLAYVIPKKGIKNGYGPFVKDYEILNKIKWNSISIPDTHDSIEFPDIEKKYLFGLELESDMTISQKACYEISLGSDDGSELWINKKRVINNAGIHGMKYKIDSLIFEAGTYNLIFWYQQIYPNRYGFDFNVEYVGPPERCTKNKKLIYKSEAETITINNQVLFDFNSSELKQSGIVLIDSLCQSIVSQTISDITIIGHTDSRGTSEYNDQLSLARAVKIKELFTNNLSMPSLRINAFGKGESALLKLDNTEEDHAQNRRVEIIIK